MSTIIGTNMSTITGTNILVEFLPGEKYYVKICNFSCSALLDSYDGGRLYLALPPAIISPELRSNSEVFLVSDVWGLGCLLNELVTGKPVWHEHRHLLDEDLQEMLEENPVPDIPSIYLELLPLFHASWETDWTKRKSVMNLKELLVMAYQNNLRNL
uniref:Protein kinase domain-containing protein n=1 Tax=Arion vulgaris TaxID=1028688 RepID=A0A0B7BAB9_9EUPU